MEALHDVVKRRQGTLSRRLVDVGLAVRKAQHVAAHIGWTRFVSMQNHYNLLYREEEREMLPLCADQGIGVIPWSPLARGRLARPWGEETNRAETDAFGRTLYDTSDSDQVIVEGRAGGRGARGAAGSGRAGLAAGEAGCHVTDRGRDEAASSRRRGRRGGPRAECGRDRTLEEPYVPHAVAGFA